MLDILLSASFTCSFCTLLVVLTISTSAVDDSLLVILSSVLVPLAELRLTMDLEPVSGTKPSGHFQSKFILRIVCVKCFLLFVPNKIALLQLLENLIICFLCKKSNFWISPDPRQNSLGFGIKCLKAMRLELSSFPDPHHRSGHPSQLTDLTLMGLRCKDFKLWMSPGPLQIFPHC